MKHFTIEELTHSDTAIGHGIANNPGAVERENLRRLAERVLDPARERLGAPIYVNSGYRNCAVTDWWAERVAHIICRGVPPTSTPAAAATPN